VPWPPGPSPDCTGTTADPVGAGLLSAQVTPTSTSSFRVVITNRAQDQCEQFVPGIDVDLTIEFRQICQNGVLGPLEYKLWGTYDGYPWHELYLRGNQIFTHDPCITGDTPNSMFPPPIGTRSEFQVQEPAFLDWRAVP